MRILETIPDVDFIIMVDPDDPLAEDAIGEVVGGAVPVVSFVKQHGTVLCVDGIVDGDDDAVCYIGATDGSNTYKFAIWHEQKESVDELI